VPITNAGAAILPYFGTQWEGDVEANVGNNLVLTIAIYDIHQPYEYVQNNFNVTGIEIVGGSQHDRGKRV